MLLFLDGLQPSIAPRNPLVVVCLGAAAPGTGSTTDACRLQAAAYGPATSMVRHHPAPSGPRGCGGTGKYKACSLHPVTLRTLHPVTLRAQHPPVVVCLGGAAAGSLSMRVCLLEALGACGVHAPGGWEARGGLKLKT